MKKEIISVILFAVILTTAYFVLGIFTEKNLSPGLLIAMIITFAITRAVLFIIDKRKEK